MTICVTFDDISPSYLSVFELNSLIDILNELTINATLFIIPYELRGSSPKTEEFIECLRKAENFGHELAMHGYRHKNKEFGFLPLPFSIPFPTYQKQLQRIRKGIKILKSAGIKPEGFRAPGYLHNNQTLKSLRNFGFKYDSSKTIFKPTHCTRFRFRWLREITPSLIHGIIEIPVTGDYTYNLTDFNLLNTAKRAIRDFQWIMALGGVFVINIHPSHSSSKKYYLIKNFLKFVRNFSEKPDFLTLRSMCNSLI